MNADEAFEKLAQEALQKFLDRNPEWGTLLGFHKPYDSLLSDGSIEKTHQDLKLMEEWLNKIQRMIEFDELDENHRMDWRLLKNAHDKLKFSVCEHRAHRKNPEALEDIRFMIFVVLAREYAPLEKRIEGIVSRLVNLPSYLEQFRESFENCVPVKLWTEIAIQQCQQIPSAFEYLTAFTKGGISEELHRRLERAITNLSQPLNTHLEWLKALLPRARADWVLGKEKFRKLLKLRGLEISTKEIEELGERLLRQMREERARLAEKISPGRTVEEVTKEIKTDAPRSFEETLELTRREIERAKKFVLEHDIATVPEGDKLRVEETPSFTVPLLPTTALVYPGKYEKTQEGIYCVSRQRISYARISNMAVKEGYPGRFLQISRSNRLASFIQWLAQNTQIEDGWALYCEEMMMKHGFQGDLKSKFIQAKYTILYATTMIVDVKLHCEKMSFDEAVDMLVKEAGLSKYAAIVGVRECTRKPGYILSHLLGKDFILKLRDEVKAEMSDRYNEKYFHDVITASGYLPMSELREIFKQKLGKP